MRTRQPGLLLGEWACLAAFAAGPQHGFAVAKRLSPEGDLGRVWTSSRPLTYRAIDTLVTLKMIRSLRAEPGEGPNRLVMALTAKGTKALHQWLGQPVSHPRDVRGELLLKIVICDQLQIDRMPLITAQLGLFQEHLVSRKQELLGDATDPVKRWRVEFAEGAIRFLQGLKS
jgi:DNA-binding PadR family transcriptional regulator